MAEVLTLCLQARRRKTAIMYKTNLSYVQAKTYLEMLISTGLLEHGSEEYTTTPKGLQFLDAFTQLEELLESRNIVPSTRSFPRTVRSWKLSP